MKQKRKTPAATTALGGVLAALAVVIMVLGGMIPAATYVVPMLCTILLQMVLISCGTRIAWAWYGAVALLGMLLSPDKEAAGVFLVIGFYPIFKPRLDRCKSGILLKVGYFNSAIVLLYLLLLKVFGLDGLREEFSELSRWMFAVLLVLGNLVFFMLDHLLGMKKFQRKF